MNVKQHIFVFLVFLCFATKKQNFLFVPSIFIRRWPIPAKEIVDNFFHFYFPSNKYERNAFGLLSLSGLLSFLMAGFSSFSGIFLFIFCECINVLSEF